MDGARARLRMAFELAELADRMHAARERRLHPDESDAEIEARVERWARERPHVVPGDRWLRCVPPTERWPRG